jgi:hypothetical protein
MQEPSESPATQSHSEPDVAIRKAVAILTKARNSLDSIRGDKDQLDVLRNALYEADAELGYAAWQVGTLKGQVRKERIAKEELEARLRALIEALPEEMPRTDA